MHGLGCMVRVCMHGLGCMVRVNCMVRVHGFEVSGAWSGSINDACQCTRYCRRKHGKGCMDSIAWLVVYNLDVRVGWLELEMNVRMPIPSANG